MEAIRLKEVLKEQNLTLKELSLRTGISQSNLSNYCSGKISPTLETLEKIANNLGIEVVELLKAKDDVSICLKVNDRTYEISEEDIINIINRNLHNTK